MIHVICIQWGNKFSDEYVTKLFRGIKRNTSKGFLFTCFSDRYNRAHNIIDEVDVQPIPHFTGDWFSKVSLYNQNLYNKDDQIFYFDLDTVITGDLDEIFEYKGDFLILRDFYRANGYGSGLMSWRPPAVHHMSQNYRGTKSRYGDQGWCEEQYPNADLWQEIFPEKVISYKVHIVGKGKLRNANHTKHGGSIDTASIVCFHGKPLPHEAAPKNKWMAEQWQ